MLPSRADDGRIGDQLLAIAREPELRRRVYDRLGDYCHFCRNRLNSLKLSLYLARRSSSSVHDETWASLERNYEELERLIERVQIICRPITLSRVTLGLDLLIEDRRQVWSQLLANRGVEFVCISPAEPAVVSLDVDRFGWAMDGIAAWRASFGGAGSATRVRWWVAAGRAHLVWEEDQSRTRFDPAKGPPADRSWALPLLARVVAAHDGETRIRDSEGWRLEVSWPSLV